MRDTGIIDFDFEEIGLSIDGADVGMFSGTASIDRDGAVVGSISTLTSQTGQLRSACLRRSRATSRFRFATTSHLFSKAISPANLPRQLKPVASLRSQTS